MFTWKVTDVSLSGFLNTWNFFVFYFSTDKKTSVSDIAAPFIVSAVCALLGVAALVFWYFRRSNKPTPLNSG